jgi:hypothetical protein
MRKGFIYHSVKHLFGTSDDDLYNKDSLLDYYMIHNAMVRDYFRYRRNDLLVLNVASPGSIGSLCAFLGREPPYDEFPHYVPHR